MALATLGVILSAWQPAFFEAQGAGDIAPLVQSTAAVSQPPVLTGVVLRSIIDQWQPGWYGPPQVRIAPALPIVNNAPTRTSVNLSTVVQSWQPPLLESQGAADIAPVLPAPPVASQPPISNKALALIASTWSQDSVTLILLDSIAPFATAPVISQPQPVTQVNLRTVLQSWQTPFFEAQGAGDIAPILPPPPVISPPPVNGRMALLSVINAKWYYDEQTVVPLTSIGAFAGAPQIDQPQPVSRVSLQIALQSWQFPFFEAQGAGDIAPLLAAPVAPSQPPIASGVLASTLIALNQPPAYALPKGGTVASWLPPPAGPSQPQPIGQATFNLIVRSWTPPVWWPLPELEQLVPAAPVVVPQPTPLAANLRVLLQAWDVVVPVTQPRPVVTASGPIPQAPPPWSFVIPRLILDQWQVNWPAQHSVPNVPGYALILAGEPRYIIKRIRARRWMVSSTTYLQFDPKAPDESVKLTFDFSPDLPAGVSLSGLPIVTYSMLAGLDSAPSSLANGSPGTDVTGTEVIVPVDGGLDQCDYKIHAWCATTDPQIVLSLTGILSVRA